MRLRLKWGWPPFEVMEEAHLSPDQIQALAVLEGQYWQEKTPEDSCGWDYYYIDMGGVTNKAALCHAINVYRPSGEYRSIGWGSEGKADLHGRYCVPKDSELGCKIKELIEMRQRVTRVSGPDASP